MSPPRRRKSGVRGESGATTAAFAVYGEVLLHPDQISAKFDSWFLALLAALIALVLYPFAPWDTGAAHFVNFIGSTMGPIFGVMTVDYYLIRKGVLNVPALYREDGEFQFQGGWHANAFIAFTVGALFSSVLPTFTTILPAWWATYGRFFGVAIGGATYYLLRMGARR